MSDGSSSRSARGTGRRTAVNDPHDRYANIDVSYLLRRMEAYDGLPILGTNLRHADDARLRRLGPIVRFPVPIAIERAVLRTLGAAVG